jgi:hypothetical protein
MIAKNLLHQAILRGYGRKVAEGLHVGVQEGSQRLWVRRRVTD